MLPTKFQVSCPFVSGEEAKNIFSNGSHPGFLIGTILAIFDLQVLLMLSTKFQVDWPIGLEEANREEAKNRCLIWPPSWISDRNDFSYFYLQVIAMLPTMFQVNWPFGSGEEVKDRF